MAASGEDIKTFMKIRDYSWESNAEFQNGLRSILATTPPDLVNAVTNRAKCFYFQKKTKVAVNDAAYEEWLASASSVPMRTEAGTVNADGDIKARGGGGATLGGVQDDMPYPKSFAEIVELITTGKPIPGIKDIPDTLLEAPKEQDTVPARRKPWELAAEKETAGNT
ncbi:hypothetical protein FN846DRAFT_394616 [Sphaerosporella brunnea]|uniref:Uncharacterized protein n=1 Tax=Sphaerosporella brunnea TaxID=1250544 RepID=A0A5J5F528_9PEZI|nr:hypothetical protein FN846DRAFT_394616 [Sphaerosporella brunnea]